MADEISGDKFHEEGECTNGSPANDGLWNDDFFWKVFGFIHPNISKTIAKRAIFKQVRVPVAPWADNFDVVFKPLFLLGLVLHSKAPAGVEIPARQYDGEKDANDAPSIAKGRIFSFARYGVWHISSK